MVSDIKPGSEPDAFDAIKYSKSAAIFRMIRGFYGEKDFNNGIRTYLKSFAYLSASQEDLWKSFSDKKISEVAQSWLEQEGFPILYVTVKSWSENDLKGKRREFNHQI